jgi:hypothetical protein
MAEALYEAGVWDGDCRIFFPDAVKTYREKAQRALEQGRPIEQALVGDTDYRITAKTGPRLYALLYLLPGGHDLRQAVDLKGNLILVGTDPATEKSEIKRPRTAILCPLECGDWHFRRFVEAGGVPKRGVLFRKKGDDGYYLAVAFEMPSPVLAQDKGNVLALVANEHDLAAYVVVGPRGDVLEQRSYGDGAETLIQIKKAQEKRMRWLAKRGKRLDGIARLSRVSKEVLHSIVNDVLEAAQRHDVATILVQPPPRAPKTTDSDATRKKLKRRRQLSLEQMRSILEYKSALAGRRVAWSSMWLRDRDPASGDPRYRHYSWQCSNCGKFDKEAGSRAEKTGKYQCSTCSQIIPTGVNTAHNLAMSKRTGP